MKRFCLASFCCLCALTAIAQLTLPEFNQDRLQRQQRAMTVLGTWAIGNIAVGAALQGRREGDERYFHRMNAYWNVVNLGLAGISLYTVSQTDPGSFDLVSSVNEHHKIQKILLFNAGLDVGYMLGGAYLIERARRASTEQPERLRGFGKSILLQGAFLFAFDVGAYLYLSGADEDLREILPVGATGDGLGLSLTF